MADPALSAFVKEALASGKSRTEIAKALSEAGWPEDQVQGALAAFAEIDFPVPVPRPHRYGSAREAFLYVVYFGLLVLVAGDIVSLSFAWIDRSFADLLSQAWEARKFAIRWPIASLLIGYPIFLAIGWRLAARRRRDPERRTSRLRAWLTYITLIFAAGTLIGDLVAVVYHFLAGELGARFTMKAAVVGVIAAAILFNYVRDVERTATGVDWPGRALAIVTTLVSITLVVWGFTVVRGPTLARERIADEQRIKDIGVLTRLMDCHVSYMGSLPTSLDAMSKALAERMRAGPIKAGCAEETPSDPVTKAAYAYRRTGDNSYELCAVFDHGWPEAAKPGETRRRALGRYRIEGRRHVELPLSGGKACFDFKAQKFKVDDDTDGADGKAP
jgi:hypothetical protein